MKDRILVNICADHTWECSTSVIGRAGEGGTSQLQILLTEDNMCNFVVYLKFKKPNGDKVRTEQLKITDNVVLYDIPKDLLTQSGKLQVQLVLAKESGEVWESSIKTYYVLESISGTEEIPEIDVITTVDNPLIATNNEEMASYLNIDYQGKIVRYTGTTDVYVNNALYQVDYNGDEYVAQRLQDYPTGTQIIAENGTYDVVKDASVTVNVTSYIEVATEDDLPETASEGTIVIVVGESE